MQLQKGLLRDAFQLVMLSGLDQNIFKINFKSVKVLICWSDTGKNSHHGVFFPLN